jgi:proteasome accessory factor A
LPQPARRPHLDVVSSAGTRSRAVIGTADEPHAGAARFRRLRVTVGDSNMSETTMLIARMVGLRMARM